MSMNETTTGDMSNSFGGSDKKKGSLLGKFNARFQDAVEQGRGEETVRQTVSASTRETAASADDLALRNAQTLTLQRMMVPEGVTVDGSISSRSETQIAGRINGDVSVEARLSLEPSAIITGKVKVIACTVQGRIEGTLEGAQDLVVGEKGQVNADVIAGKDITIAGQITGNVHCGGRARLMNTAKLTGNIKARSVVVDDGATFNGMCNMSKSSQPQAQQPAQAQPSQQQQQAQPPQQQAQAQPSQQQQQQAQQQQKKSKK